MQTNCQAQPHSDECMGHLRELTYLTVRLGDAHEQGKRKVEDLNRYIEKVETEGQAKAHYFGVIGGGSGLFVGLLVGLLLGILIRARN